eukprot:10572412-Ditylum_brightwellii.AAC.1
MPVARRVTQVLSDNPFDFLQVEDISNYSESSFTYMLSVSQTVYFMPTLFACRAQVSPSPGITLDLPFLTKLIQLTWAVDTGSNDHMCNEQQYFTDLTECNRNKYVTFEDGATRLPIKGKGTIQIKVNQYNIKLINVLYVFGLESSLFGIKRHMCIQGCSQHADQDYILVFPTFTFIADIKHKITFQSTIT